MDAKSVVDAAKTAGIVGEQAGECGFVDAGFYRPSAHPVAKALELAHVQSREPLVLVHRHHHRHVAFLPLNRDGLASGGINQCSEALFGFACCNRFHDKTPM